MDFLDKLTNEHRGVEDLLSRLKETEAGGKRDDLVEQLTAALRSHMSVEERFVYPIVIEAIGQEPEQEAEVEHQLARDGLQQLTELRAEPGFGAAVDMVEAGIAHHVHEEERQIFPELRRQALPQIGALDFDECKEAVGGGFIDLTKEELYHRAQDADIPGRSSMSKEELADALAHQEPPEARREKSAR